MAKNIEIEAKGLLDKDEYELIFHKLSLKPYVQINYYIKNDHFDFKQYGLRIRFKDNKYELTLKDRIDDGYIEINQMINEQEFLDMKNKNLFPLGEVNSYLQNKNISTNDLYIFASAKTERIDIHYHTSLISIDKTTIFDHIDYEIECENTNIKKAKDDIISFLDQFSIKYKENKTSKLKRVLSLI